MLPRSCKVGREARSWHEGGELSPAKPARVMLARSVDLGYHNPICAAQAVREFVAKRQVARVAVRLEDQHQPLVVELTSRGECYPDLGGVMTVVVVERCALPRAQALHPPTRARER